MYEGLRRTGSLQEKAQTMHVALFGLYVSFRIWIFNNSNVLLLPAYNYHPQPSNTPPRRIPPPPPWRVPPPTPQRTAMSPHYLHRIRARDTMTCLEPLSFLLGPYHHPKNTHRARMMVKPSFGPNKYFFIFIFIFILVLLYSFKCN